MRPETWLDELRAKVERELAMREPRCTCGHVLSAHNRRKLNCPAARWCGCTGWTPTPKGTTPVTYTPKPRPPMMRPRLNAEEAALLLDALELLGGTTTDYERLKASTELAARLRIQAHVFGLDWLEAHP